MIREREGRTKKPELGYVSIFINHGYKWVELIVHRISRYKPDGQVHAFNPSIPEVETGGSL